MDINLSQAEAEQLKAAQAQIAAEIKEKGGWIPFSRYMERALYDPKFGYYVSDLKKFGDGGDFITAPEISPFFGQTITNTILPVLEGFKKKGLPTRILEFGAGTGQLAKSILLELQLRRFQLDSYDIIEISPTLAARQKSLLTETCKSSGIQTKINWRNQPPQPFEGIIFANEVLDAFPCERIIHHQNAWHHLGVSVETNHSSEILVSAIGPQVSQKDIDPILQTGSNFAEGYTTEIHPHALEWVMKTARTLKQGMMMLIDYGFPESEYYHPQRNGGTLMTHHRHRANPDLLKLPGISDITCHINFSNLMRSLENESGAELFFSSQASYLLNAGIGDLVLQKADPLDQKRFIAVSNEIQKLISEAEMGELFKVMAFGKNLTGLDLSLHTLPGFGGRNRLY